MRCISMLPGLSASSAREVVAPYSTATPAHRSAMTTPWSVKNELKGLPSAVQCPGRKAGRTWRPGSRAAAGYREARRKGPLLPRNPEPTARLGGAGAGRLLGLARRRRRALAGLARDPRVGELQLRHRVAHLHALGAERGLDQRQQRAHALDRLTQLLGVALVLAARRQPGLAPAEADQRQDGLDEDVLDADLLELGLVGRAQLLFSGLALPPSHRSQHTSRGWCEQRRRRPRAARRRRRAPAAGAAPR